jgi:hypothetical protein
MPTKKHPRILKEIKAFIPKETNYKAGEKNISYSQYSMYKTCGRKWDLIYKQKLFPYTSNIHTTFGTAIHEALQNDLTLAYNQSSPIADEFDAEELFKDRFIEIYQENYEKNNNQHFSNPDELREFYEDGLKIISYFKKNRRKYFSKRGWYLVGIELPLLITPNPKFKKIRYKGLLDVVLYNEVLNKFHILDFKTSSYGWGDKNKKDTIKQNQLLLYKEFFSKQYNIPLENIHVEFFILKRKLYENSEFVIKRIQQYSPISGKTKMKRALESFNDFIEECFNIDGTFKEINHPPTFGNHCQWCPFNNDEKNCKKHHS